MGFKQRVRCTLRSQPHRRGLSAHGPASLCTHFTGETRWSPALIAQNHRHLWGSSLQMI